MRACTRFCTEPGMPASALSSACRSSCSRNSGLPAARSTHRSANRSVASKNAPASVSASSRRSGPRSIVVSGAPAVRLRHSRPSGSPSSREVMTRSAGHSATVDRQLGQMGQLQRAGPVDVLDHQQARLRPARPLAPARPPCVACPRCASRCPWRRRGRAGSFGCGRSSRSLRKTASSAATSHRPPPLGRGTDRRRFARDLEAE